MNSLQANDSLILLKLDTADVIDKIVFNVTNKTHSTLVLRAILFVVTLSPEKNGVHNVLRKCIVLKGSDWVSLTQNRTVIHEKIVEELENFSQPH